MLYMCLIRNKAFVTRHSVTIKIYNNCNISEPLLHSFAAFTMLKTLGPFLNSESDYTFAQTYQ